MTTPDAPKLPKDFCGPQNTVFPHGGVSFFRNKVSGALPKSVDCGVRYSQHAGHNLMIKDECIHHAFGSYPSAEAFIEGLDVTPTGANQHLYEVLRSMSPRHFYLDLDWANAQHPDEREVVRRHVAFVVDFVRERYKLPNLEVKVEVCCATGDLPDKGYTKVSYHIKFDFYFSDQATAKDFAKALHQAIKAPAPRDDDVAEDPQ